MAEYLSPGVYVQEFDSGGVPMQGVSTSTAGFIGMAQRGDTEGIPRFLTSFADFQRQFGSYLPANPYGNNRFLAYAVEHFFNNGGSRCFVMRVAAADAKPAKAVSKSADVSFSAKNPGLWGNGIRAEFIPSSKAKTTIKAIVGDASNSTQYRVASPAGFLAGDIVGFTSDGKTKLYNQVVSVQDDVITFAQHFAGDAAVIDDGKTLPPVKVLTTCEFTLAVTFGQEQETYENCSLNELAPNHVEKLISRSNIIAFLPKAAVLPPKEKEQEKEDDGTNKAADEKEETNDPATPVAPEPVQGIVSPFQTISALGETSAPDNKLSSYSIFFEGGSDGTVTDDPSKFPSDIYMGTDNGPGRRTGIKAFIDNDEVSIISVPGVTDPAVQVALVAHCENLASRFAILDIPQAKKRVDEVQAHRNIFDTSYAALYHPWLQVYDPLEKRNIFIPPSGSMAGIYARSDQSRGVYKAPANEVVRGCIGLDCQYNTGEQDILNPIGVNLIRAFTGQGIRVWGARTCSSNGLWKYVNVRRLFIYVEQSIKTGTNWVVFEPNDQTLWSRVNLTIDAFLTTVWRSGALMGGSPSEAFYVQIGRNTMTQDDIDNGRLICVIGIAPVKPAEFVIFRITQKTGGDAS
ncbi:phage tail sheath family protein [Paenibacillus sp. 481]|uniref:phage tail sheath family protein n=1 Tax=Paenibacillus sp. 481 TaxID=2835869 RepID=UPI001E5F1E6B|nr:phage tail sheath subtilisin-like domain-containing protein [Paenibacillus sp. 481]UHA73469.1 phage tail sheath family protein [Paenibacillus sp. 481]